MILIAYGTRPEIIKLFPLVREFERQGLPFKTLFSDQHLDLYNDVKDLMPEPDYFLKTADPPPQTLADSFCRMCSEFEKVVIGESFDLVIVQGDTTTACAIAAVSFYNETRVAHIEAGLRTYDLSSPFPEEANRRMISQVAYLNFAPTERAFLNLQKEGVRNVFLTGNTIVDALDFFNYGRSFSNTALITIHRRENHKQMRAIFNELNEAATNHPAIQFIFPIHPNPNVQKFRTLLKGDNLRVIEPVGYPEMLRYISDAGFIISDSGGLQEEAVYFGKKILIVRKNTERPETVESGLGKLVGLDIVENIGWALKPSDPPENNPFGEGDSCRKISEIITTELY